jgi:hypothetical protein
VLHKYFDIYSWVAMCDVQGCMVGCMGRMSYTNLKNSYGDFQNRNFDKSHRTTGPRADLRLADSCSCGNSGLLLVVFIYSTFGNVETGKFWVTTRGAFERTVYVFRGAKDDLV